MKPEATRCPTCGRRKTRSNNANARLWLLYHKMSDKLKPQGNAYTAETWHEYCKSRFLGMDDVKLPNGKVIHKAKSSADLSTEEFSEFMAAVESWAMEHGVYLDEMEEMK